MTLISILVFMPRTSSKKCPGRINTGTFVRLESSRIPFSIFILLFCCFFCSLYTLLVIAPQRSKLI